MTTTPNPVYVALDTADVKTALALAGAVRPYVGGLKVGLEFVSANGPDGVRAVVALGLPVFLDVKLHDIPTTVAGAVKALSALGVAIINVHASGGTAMMRAACGPDFTTIVPGSRPAGSDAQDQKRVMTPAAARAAGADILILGRPVTAAADPAAAARAVAVALGFA